MENPYFEILDILPNPCTAAQESLKSTKCDLKIPDDMRQDSGAGKRKRLPLLRGKRCVSICRSCGGSNPRKALSALRYRTITDDKRIAVTTKTFC